MAGGTIPKIRLVRCPKCRLVLQEVPDFPVYKCGGCDTILVAKSQKAVADTTSVLQETEASSADDDRYKKDRDTSRDSDGDCEKVDENGSDKGKENGDGQSQLENLEYCIEDEAEGNLEAEANDDTLQLEGDDKIDGGSSIDNPQATRETNLTVSDNLLEQPQKTQFHVFDRLRSVDTFETADFGSLGSEDSVSDDGMDDQKLHSFKNSYNKAAKYLVPEETRQRGKLPAKSTSNGLRDPARNLSLDFSNKKRYATQKYSMGHRDERPQPVMHHHHPPRYRPRLGTDEYPSHIPFSRKASLHGYESAGPSCESQDEFPFDSNLYPLEKTECTEQENMKLLRMLHELQDQISKTCHLNGRPSIDAPLRQNQFPAFEDEDFYPRHHGRHGPKSSWSQQSRFEHMPLSGGGINTRYSIDSSCLYSHSQYWQRSSEQLRPPIFRHNRELCRADPGYSYNAYSSYPSSPLIYLESDFSNQRYRDHNMKRYSREKHHSVWRHVRPTAGGAPFVACYYCFTPLQLPADFLLFKRKWHQLRCGACAKVLKFSFLKGIHIVPYELVAAEPSPSEVDDRSDAINARISTLASRSHDVLQADPMSYSEEYGHSFCKSCSTDGDPVSYMEQREGFILKPSQNKHKTSMEAFGSAEPTLNMSGSDRVSPEVEELPPRTGGKSLHHLMGYSSPNQLIYGLISSMSGTSSVHSDETSD